MSKIGLEIHCQLTRLNSKLFCPCRADYRGMAPNENICPVCIGLPGTLPRVNRAAVEKAAAIAMALGCQTPPRIAFFRKNYFYPDLPKNYQITQLDIFGPTSMGSGGQMTVDGKKIRIKRVQLEEDPGRLVYEGASEKTQMTLADYNRAGVALVEIVTEPDFEGPRQVRMFLNQLSDLLENLDVSDPGLEGAMRADGNVSVRDGPKVEIKNIGSFHDLEKAIHYEITRQESLAERGIAIEAETRHWDDRRRITIPARTKEADLDYRYFLEGDIPWITIGDSLKDRLQSEMPESTGAKRERYVSEYGIPAQVADVLSSDRYFSDLFERAHDKKNARDIANLITTDLMGLLDTREKRQASRLTPEKISDLADAVISSKISRASAKEILPELVSSDAGLDELVKSKNLASVSDESELAGIIDAVVSKYPDAVSQARENPQTVHYLLGMVMKETAGRADPKIAMDLLKKRIGGSA